MPAKRPKLVRFGIVGYGGAFNMGRGHANWINAIPGLQTVAVCDPDRARLKVATEELPGVETYTSLADMLRKAPVDNCVIITPHNTHAPLALQCLKAGKGVILEKPFCLTIKEATAMIDAAREAKAMLTVFHNRRFDGDFMALKAAIDKGLIGDLFHVEQYGGGYGHPGYWWRADKVISGGAFYDWGAHFLDWLLNIVPGPMLSVTGYFHKRVWTDVTNEDQVEATIRFHSGCVANIQMSHLSMAGKPRWRVLGTKGAIEVQPRHRKLEQSLLVYRDGERGLVEEVVPYGPEPGEKTEGWGSWSLVADMYRGLADHFLLGDPVPVTPESANRVIGVIEAATLSALSGRPEPPTYW